MTRAISGSSRSPDRRRRSRAVSSGQPPGARHQRSALRQREERPPSGGYLRDLRMLSAQDRPREHSHQRGDARARGGDRDPSQLGAQVLGRAHVRSLDRFQALPPRRARGGRRPGSSPETSESCRRNTCRLARLTAESPVIASSAVATTAATRKPSPTKKRVPADMSRRRIYTPYRPAYPKP